MRSRAEGTQHLAAQVLFDYPAIRFALQIHHRRPYAHRGLQAYPGKFEPASTRARSDEFRELLQVSKDCKKGKRVAIKGHLVFEYWPDLCKGFPFGMIRLFPDTRNHINRRVGNT